MTPVGSLPVRAFGFVQGFLSVTSEVVNDGQANLEHNYFVFSLLLVPNYSVQHNSLQ